MESMTTRRTGWAAGQRVDVPVCAPCAVTQGIAALPYSSGATSSYFRASVSEVATALAALTASRTPRHRGQAIQHG